MYEYGFTCCICTLQVQVLYILYCTDSVFSTSTVYEYEGEGSEKEVRGPTYCTVQVLVVIVIVVYCIRVLV